MAGEGRIGGGKPENREGRKQRHPKARPHSFPPPRVSAAWSAEGRAQSAAWEHGSMGEHGLCKGIDFSVPLQAVRGRPLAFGCTGSLAFNYTGIVLSCFGSRRVPRGPVPFQEAERPSLALRKSKPGTSVHAREARGGGCHLLEGEKG